MPPVQVVKKMLPSQITDNAVRLIESVKEARICDITDQELKSALVYCYAVVGIRGQNLPAGAEKEFLHEYIRVHFGIHTASEIRLAFDMAIQGKLDIQQRDVNCYENFSVAYFARIMGAYRGWSAEQFRISNTKAEDFKLPDPQELKKIDAEYADYLLSKAYKKLFNIDKLPVKVCSNKSAEKQTK